LEVADLQVEHLVEIPRYVQAQRKILFDLVSGVDLHCGHPAMRAEGQCHFVVVVIDPIRTYGRPHLNLPETALMSEDPFYALPLGFQLCFILDVLPLTPPANAEVTAFWGGTKRARLDDLEQVGLGVVFLLFDNPDGNAIAGHSAVNENGHPVDASHGFTPICELLDD